MASSSIPSEVTSTPSTSTFSLSLSNAHHFISLKLTTTNFLYWITQIFPYLRSQDLLGYIDGSNPCPPKIITVDEKLVANLAYHAWIRQDQLLVSLLVASLTEEVIPLIVGLETSQSIYHALKTSFASVSNTRIMQLHMDLHSLKQEDQSVSTYLQRAKSIADALHAAGQPLSLADLNIYILRGLRSEFKVW